MKNIVNIRIFVILLGLTMGASSCVKDLLDQQPTTQLPKDAFWKTTNDALTGLYGAYGDVRRCLDMEFWHDGQTGFSNVLGNYNSWTDTYNCDYGNPTAYGSGMSNMFRALYMGVIRCNYVIDNVEAMLPDAKPELVPQLEGFIGEARVLRGLCYLKLMSWWGDVQIIEHDVKSNADVATLGRSPLATVKDLVVADFTYAYEKLPAQNSSGRPGKPAALALRGKMNLYWASWNKYGWPELEGFAPSQTEATNAYKAAADDFRKVIDDYGLTLYMNGAPGPEGYTPVLGQAEQLPYYYELFTPEANGKGESLMYFTHGGPGSEQSESYLRVLGNHLTQGAQSQFHPRVNLVDRYQSTITGDFCDPLIPCDPNGTTEGVSNLELTNSAVNPKSYENRDWRLKASIIWDREIFRSMLDLKDAGWGTFIYRRWTVPTVIYDGSTVISAGIDHNYTGYLPRKFVRRNAGALRTEGNCDWPVIRLADVFLMYAEADNEANGPQTKAIGLVNQVRHRGNLPALAASKTATKEDFFKAIEQERLIELYLEGSRLYDVRRWRKLEEFWGGVGGPGVRIYDTWGVQQAHLFQNFNELTFQRCYINEIPNAERDKNPNLTQNKPWL